MCLRPYSVTAPLKSLQKSFLRHHCATAIPKVCSSSASQASLRQRPPSQKLFFKIHCVTARPKIFLKTCSQTSGRKFPQKRFLGPHFVIGPMIFFFFQKVFRRPHCVTTGAKISSKTVFQNPLRHSPLKIYLKKSLSDSPATQFPRKSFPKPLLALRCVAAFFF